MVGRASALLVLTLGATLGLYSAFHDSLWEASTWWDIAFLGLVLIPASFAVVWLVLPLRTLPGLLFVGIGFGVLAVLFHLASWNGAENFCKLFGVTAVGFWFLSYFESLSWVVLVALIIPWVDLYSVWRGPTHDITQHHIHVFNTFSFAFPIPGERASANLGLPDLLFFALFAAAAARFNLRVGLTWLLMTLSFGATLVLAYQSDRGFAALPLLALGFLLANCDLVWRRLRREGLPARRSAESETRSSGHSGP
jgi:hypothetical protein